MRSIPLSKLLFVSLLFAALLVMSQSCHRQTVTTTSKWQATPPKNASDWAGIPRFYDKSSKLSYDVANDDKTLYIFVKAVDRDLQMKILRTGFNIWLDTTDKKKQILGVRFPLPASERIMTHEGGDGQNREQGQGQRQGAGTKPDMSKIRENMSKHIQEMDLIRLADGKSARTTSKNNYGVTATLDMDDAGVLYYQLSVPLKDIFGDIKPDEIAMKRLTIGLETNKVDAPPVTHRADEADGEVDGGAAGDVSGMHGSEMGGGGSRGGAMGGGPPGGGMGGTPAGGYANNDNDTQVKIWAAFIMANSQTTQPANNK